MDVTGQRTFFTCQFCHYVASEFFGHLMLPTLGPDGALKIISSQLYHYMASTHSRESSMRGSVGYFLISDVIPSTAPSGP